MITLKEWMELTDHKITEGSDYGWACYGPNSFQLNSWNGVHGTGGHSFSIVFSTKTQKVYEVSVCDYTHDRAYRMIAENKRNKYAKEAGDHAVNRDQAWDDVEYVDLEVDDDFMQKCLAIRNSQDYSTDVSVALDLPNDLLMSAFMAAHAQDLTLNQYINQALRHLAQQVQSGQVSAVDAKAWLESTHD